jgi:hypothetical protein
LLGKGTKTPVSAATNINKDSRDNKQNNRVHLTARHGDSYSSRVAVIKESSFVNSRVVEISRRFFREIRQADGIQEFNV